MRKSAGEVFVNVGEIAVDDFIIYFTVAAIPSLQNGSYTVESRNLQMA